MTLVQGSKLTAEQRAHVLRAFVYRWTVDNSQRETAWRPFLRDGTAPTMPLVTDAEWLETHQFRVGDDGSALYGYAEPYYGAARDCPTVRVFSPPGDEMPLCDRPLS